MNASRAIITAAVNRMIAKGGKPIVNKPVPTIYSQLVKLAAPIVTAYHEDVTVHDRKTCRNLDIGDTVLWLANPCGTHMVRIRHDADENVILQNREYFRAVVSNHPTREWKHARCIQDQGRGMVVHTTPDAIEAYFRGRLETAAHKTMSYEEIAAS